MTMRTLVLALTVTIAAGPLDAWAGQKEVTQDVEVKALRQMVAAIPPGSRVRLQTRSGQRLTATLMSVSPDAIIVKKHTRMPEPAVTIAIDELARVEREDKPGLNIGKAIGIGLAAGAGAILTMFAIAFSLDD